MPHHHPALPDHRPLIIAHRAGNSLNGAARAIQRGANMLEADIWRYDRRLEIRHLKTMGPVPLLWDHWRLAPGWTPRLELGQLLDATPADTRIMLDLKGDDPMLAPSIVRAIRDRQPDRKIILCSRVWLHLDRVSDDPDVHRVYSVGNDQERATVWSRLEAMDHPGVSINRSLMSPATARRFAGIGVTVIVWGATSRDDVRWLLDYNIDGLTLSEGPLQDWLLSQNRTPGAGLPPRPEEQS